MLFGCIILYIKEDKSMLELKGIRWSIPDGEEILKGIDLTIPDGKLTVITGPNGGGKTSLAKIIAGLYEPSHGTILLENKDITALDITERAKAGIAFAFQQPVRFKGLSVRDLLELSAARSLTEKEACDYLSKVGLCAKEYINREANASLSGGESKRIEIATVLARKDAKMLVFDEPEAGIDLWSFNNLISAFEDLKKEGDRSLLVISHQERIMEIADYIVVVADGKVQSAGLKAAILPNLFKDEKASSCPFGITEREEY